MVVCCVLDSNDPSPPHNPTQSSIRKRQFVEEEIDTRSNVSINLKTDDVTAPSHDVTTPCRSGDLTKLLMETDFRPAQYGVLLAVVATFLSLGGDISLIWMLPGLFVCSVAMFSWLKL